MKSHVMRRQRGMAALALLVVLILGSLWWLVSALSTPANRTALKRDHNAKVLQQAKAALIGYVAQQAAKSDENDPGALPCPEAPGNIGSVNEGVAAGNCGLPAVGRLPWRTLGLEKPHDASAEPLWYVVSPGWAKPSSTANTIINSNSVGQLTLDATANAAVALIIASGDPLLVQASANCTARNQARSVPSPSMDTRDYIECYNTATSAFSSTGPSSSFNDQVLPVTAAELLPAIEAAIAVRFEREIAPAIRTTYSGGSWPLPPVLPFAAPFTSSFKGASAYFQGLLPVSYSETSPGSETACTPGSDSRCDPMFVAWQPPIIITRTGGADLASYSCSISTVTVNPSPLTQTTRIDCTLYVITTIFAPNTWMSFDLEARANNAGMALRQLDKTIAMPGIDSAPREAIGILNTDGSARVTLSARVPTGGGTAVGDLLCLLSVSLGVTNDCYRHNISVPIFLLADHPLLDANNSTYGWFVRNKWHEVSYYAVASDIAPSGPRSCSDVAPITCLQVTYHPKDGKQRGLVVIAGRSLPGQIRPPTAPSDLLEAPNADGDATFAVRSPTLWINRTFNDRIAVIDSNP